MLRKIELGKLGNRLRGMRIPEINLNPISLVFLINSWIFLYLGLQITKLHGIASFYAERIAAVAPSMTGYIDLARIAGPVLVIYAMLQIAAAVTEVLRND